MIWLWVGLAGLAALTGVVVVVAHFTAADPNTADFRAVLEDPDAPHPDREPRDDRPGGES